MKNKTHYTTQIIISLILITFITSCSLFQKNKKNMNDQKILVCSDTVKVKKGETFKIEMKSNPTTGYMWQIDELYLNKQMLKFENKEYKSDNNENKLVGAGGVEVWIFKALEKGETCFSMIYLRDFEKKEIAKTKNIKVIIE